LGDFWGWVIFGFSGSVGSARSQLFMPGLHHAHTLQHPKKMLMDAHPRESVLINMTRQTIQQYNDNAKQTRIITTNKD